MSKLNEFITIVMEKNHGFFQRGFKKKKHWVQSDRTQSGPPCHRVRCWRQFKARAIGTREAWTRVRGGTLPKND